jgi:TonB family protein
MNAELLARNIAAHWLQAGVLAASALMAMRLLKLNEPRAKLAALQLVLISILLLPLIQPWRPEAPALQMAQSATTVNVSAVITETAEGIEPGAAPWLNPARGAVVLVAAGIMMRLFWLLYGVIRLARFNGRASPVPPPAVAGALEEELAVSPRYIQQTGSRGPWTFGFVRPTVALPAGFDALIPAFQRSVICHELVHVKRRDMAVALCEELAVAALWFHPWMWLLRARIRVAREQVVDGRVVTMLGNRDEYVRCLVDISGHDLAPHFSQAGAGMLRPRELRARVDAIFQEVHMSRRRLTAMTAALVIAVGGTGWVTASTVPLRAPIVIAGPSSIIDRPSSIRDRASSIVNQPSSIGDQQAASALAGRAQNTAAAEAPRRQAKMGFAEYPVDAFEKGIRGTVMVSITVNPAGQVTTAFVVSGPPELRTSAFRAAMALEFAPAQTTTAMTIGVEYVLSGNSWGVRIGSMSSGQGTAKVAPRVGPDSSGAVRVGGNIMPPKKVADVPPKYPEEARSAKVQGVVILEVLVDESGNVGDTRVLRSIPLVDQAAIDAVKQWKYTPTLLNGVAVPVIMTVTVNFTLRDGGPGTVVRLNVSIPEEHRRGAQENVRLTVRANDVGLVFGKDNEAFGFVPMFDENSSDPSTRIAIYRMNPNIDQAQAAERPEQTFHERVVARAQLSGPPQLLGSVNVVPGGGTVYSSTVPSFGVEVESVTAR